MGLAVASEIRAQKRFKQSSEVEERIAAANIKPLLGVISSADRNGRSVTLLNEGLGTAVITEIVFRKGDRQESSLTSLLELGVKFEWDVEREFGKQGRGLRFIVYLRAGDRADLLSLSANGLRDQGFADTKIDELFRTLDSQILGTKIVIRFQYVLRNDQPHYQFIID